MADNVIKINLNESNNWENFVEKLLAACINRNKTVKEGQRYGFKYYGDDIDLCLFHVDDAGIAWNEINGVGLDQETYEASNKSDKDIIESLFNTIQSNS